MGSVLSSEGREATTVSTSGPRGGVPFPLRLEEAAEQQQAPSFDCSICLEVLHQPVRTQCGHVFCHSCIATSLRNNTWTCPYCRAYLPSEGIPATDIIKMMKNMYQKCTECETQVCLSEMRAHLRTCDQYIEKYGPLQEVAYPITRYPCPLCQYELDESDLLDHFLTHHRSERRAVIYVNCTYVTQSFSSCRVLAFFGSKYPKCFGEVMFKDETQYCPICRLLPDGGPSYYSRSFIRHLQLRHTFYYEDYIDINIVEEVLIERVLDQSFLEYVHGNNPNTA